MAICAKNEEETRRERDFVLLFNLQTALMLPMPLGCRRDYINDPPHPTPNRALTMMNCDQPQVSLES